MKVKGPSGPSGPSKISRKNNSSGGGGNFSAEIAGEASGPSEAAAPSNAQSIAQMDALLAIQGAEDPTQGRAKQRMRKRANEILDVLDQLRLKMLSGKMTVGDMINIADVVASHREKVEDPTLSGLMDEVDLRAQVELAKMRVALDQQAAANQR